MHINNFQNVELHFNYTFIVVTSQLFTSKETIILKFLFCEKHNDHEKMNLSRLHGKRGKQ